MESKSEQRTERDEIHRPPAEYHFFHSRKFFTFSFLRPSPSSPSSFQEDRHRMREKERRISPFPFLCVDCVLSRCQTRRAVTRPVVCQPRREISLKAPPLYSFFFFLPLSSTTKSVRGL